MVAYFNRVVATPHILTELSNLAGQLGSQHRPGCFGELAKMILHLLDERTVPARDIATADDFPRLGLTDTGIEKIAPGSCLVVTDDFPLSNRLDALRIDVLNYNHLRFRAVSQ